VPTKKWYVTPVGREPSASNPKIPDILNANEQAWGDLHGVSQLVRFAFEGGECTGVFDAVIDATPTAPSSWNPEAFASHLFLDDLVRSSFKLEIAESTYQLHQGFLVGLLSKPPSDLSDIQARQDVFRELLDCPDIRRDMENAYEALHKLRTNLEGPSPDDTNSVSRKFEVLAALRDCVESFAGGFAGSRSKLRLLHETGVQHRADAGYEQLLQLLDLEQNMATVDVRLRLGIDGHVQKVQLLAVEENRKNQLLPGVCWRVWQRLMKLARGHRYSDREIVVSLLHEVFAPLVDAVVTFLALLGPIEFYLAGLGFRDHAEKSGLGTCLPDVVAPPDSQVGVGRVLEGVFNPLLFLQETKVVPANVTLDRHDALVLLTGPNSGGKTRFLQAIAIIQCMGQAGMFVPASKANLVCAPALYVSLVEEVDAGQSEGRLGTELSRIRKLFEELKPAGMAILDELCSGTNPTEGEEIAEMVISLLPKLHPQVFVSTHYLGLVQRLERERPVERLEFFEVELDLENCPTYGFVRGVAKSALARVLAARLGVTWEELGRIVGLGG